ncbi:hypothetical protein ACJ73_05874 [Blastomyces percursus]|uniref:Uncharacterized protein n=1 Tax=Blastomyces percursus TaxID=1658174 RepID=A0A1J9R440_9EURO|nr:hypothetical protein ACJ73_05874 [Blastomyces percursus]
MCTARLEEDQKTPGEGSTVCSPGPRRQSRCSLLGISTSCTQHGSRGPPRAFGRSPSCSGRLMLTWCSHWNRAHPPAGPIR